MLQKCNGLHRREDISFSWISKSKRKPLPRLSHQFKDGCRMRNSRWVWEQTNGPIPKGYIIHHLDGDTLNDNIQNLKCIPSNEHTKFHMDEQRPSRLGKKASEETRAKLSYSHAGENNAMYGQTQSEETKAKIRAKAIGRKLTEETKEKLRLATITARKKKHWSSGAKGKHLSDEHKRKLSESLLKSDKNKGRHWTEEHKRRISESLLKRTP